VQRKKKRKLMMARRGAEDAEKKIDDGTLRCRGRREEN
jgi:hypothetical protein